MFGARMTAFFSPLSSYDDRQSSDAQIPAWRIRIERPSNCQTQFFHPNVRQCSGQALPEMRFAERLNEVRAETRALRQSGFFRVQNDSGGAFAKSAAERNDQDAAN